MCVHSFGTYTSYSDGRVGYWFCGRPLSRSQWGRAKHASSPCLFWFGCIRHHFTLRLHIPLLQSTYSMYCLQIPTMEYRLFPSYKFAIFDVRSEYQAIAHQNRYSAISLHRHLSNFRNCTHSILIPTMGMCLTRSWQGTASALP